jgi:hypothetical protein
VLNIRNITLLVARGAVQDCSQVFGVFPATGNAGKSVFRPCFSQTLKLIADTPLFLLTFVFDPV